MKLTIHDTITILAIGVCMMILYLTQGCGITVKHVIEGDPTVHYDKQYIEVTGNIPIILPSGNYTLSGNELIIR